MQTYSTDILIRPRRQATFPKKLLEKIGASVGDRLAVSVKDKSIVLRTRKREALDALEEIQRIVKASGVSEAELQDEAKRYRIRKWKEEHAA